MEQLIDIRHVQTDLIFTDKDQPSNGNPANVYFPDLTDIILDTSQHCDWADHAQAIIDASDMILCTVLHNKVKKISKVCW